MNQIKSDFEDIYFNPFNKSDSLFEDPNDPDSHYFDEIDYDSKYFDENEINTFLNNLTRYILRVTSYNTDVFFELYETF